MVKLVRETADRSGNAQSYTFKVGRSSVKLVFASNTLVDKFTPAFQHIREIEHSDSHLTIYLIDSASGQTAMPIPPWQTDRVLELGEMWVGDGNELKIKHQPTENTLMMLNLKSAEAVYWVKDASEVPYYESSAPLRHILHWWLGAQDAQLLHSAAIGLPNKGLLLVGKGGSGKSNTAVSCLDSELSYVSDDYCMLTFEPHPVAYSLFATAKLHSKDLGRHPYLNPARFDHQTDDTTDEKALFMLYPKFKDRLITKMPIKAILLPKVAYASEAEIAPIGSAKAYLALAPSTIFQMHGNRKGSHENLARLIKEVPSFEMSLSTDPKRNLDAIRNFLDLLPN